MRRQTPYPSLQLTFLNLDYAAQKVVTNVRLPPGRVIKVYY
jgi:hypothetical protein